MEPNVWKLQSTPESIIEKTDESKRKVRLINMFNLVKFGDANSSVVLIVCFLLAFCIYKNS